MDKHTTKSQIINAPVPESTKSYTAIPNEAIIDAIGEALDQKGFRILAENYQASLNCQESVGNITIDGGDDSLLMNMSWVNSYNKSKRFSIANGVTVHKCANHDFSHFRTMRKHSRNIWNDFDEMIRSAIGNIEVSFQEIKADYQRLAQTPLHKDEIPELLGKLFYEQELITSSQLNKLTANMKEQELWGLDNLHDFYMHTTDALKSTHPRDLVENHTQAHQFIMGYVDQEDLVSVAQL